MKIKLKVHTNSKQEKIIGRGDKEFEIWIKEKPFEGKANIYLEKLCKKYFKKDVKIVRGLKSKNKLLDVAD